MASAKVTKYLKTAQGEVKDLIAEIEELEQSLSREMEQLEERTQRNENLRRKMDEAMKISYGGRGGDDGTELAAEREILTREISVANGTIRALEQRLESSRERLESAQRNLSAVEQAYDENRLPDLEKQRDEIRLEIEGVESKKRALWERLECINKDIDASRLKQAEILADDPDADLSVIGDVSTLEHAGRAIAQSLETLEGKLESLSERQKEIDESISDELSKEKYAEAIIARSELDSLLSKLEQPLRHCADAYRAAGWRLELEKLPELINQKVRNLTGI